jgi:integrase
VDKDRSRGKAISVRGIQKCLEHYARQARLKVSCHQLRHTMATQLLNVDAALVTIQDLLVHTRIKTTQRYCRVSNLKVQRDYHQAMAVVLQRMERGGDNENTKSYVSNQAGQHHQTSLDINEKISQKMST